ncbi:MAG: hypothetical protein E7048_02955 [Lentisphaerae bacterium]|nr:hypothetical protein [Lentisphaerota bacterium]
MKKLFAATCAILMLIIFHIDLLFSFVSGSIVILMKKVPGVAFILIRLFVLNCCLFFLKASTLPFKHLQHR